MKPLLRSSIAALAILFPAAMAEAETPADTLVMAYVIDDIISLDPAEIYEFTASEYMATPMTAWWRSTPTNHRS